MSYIADGLSLTVSLAGNLFLGGLFFTALVNPQNTEFIFRTGMLIYFVEFLSIHSSGMAFGARKKERGDNDLRVIFHFAARGPGKNILQQNPKYTLVFFYAIFVFSLGLIFKNWYVPIYFLISLITKFFEKKALRDNLQIGLPILLFLLSTFVAVFAFPILLKLFPFPPKFSQYRMSGSSGLFVDYPQVLMVWGVTYFLSLSIVEIILFFKKRADNKTRPA